MAPNSSAFIFPAFPFDYSDHPGRLLPGFFPQFESFLERTAPLTGMQPVGFAFETGQLTGEELVSQYFTYLYSCAASVVVRKLLPPPAFSSGYSMGIYAALFDAGAISLESGVALIQTAFMSLKAVTAGKEYGMASVIGLDEVDLKTIISAGNLSVEVTNQNAAGSFILSGQKDDLLRLLAISKAEGALNTRELNVTIPYHCGFLENGARDFSLQTGGIEIKTPAQPVVSMIDRTILNTPELLRKELVRNLFQPFSWYRTQLNYLESGVRTFIECGPSRSLTRNSRFIGGDYIFLSLDKINPALP